jgi:hypothetical protein
MQVDVAVILVAFDEEERAIRYRDDLNAALSKVSSPPKYVVRSTLLYVKE